jgi:hypothetical protein
MNVSYMGGSHCKVTSPILSTPWQGGCKMRSALVLLTFILVFSQLHAIVRTVNVDGSADYTTIQSAIDACSDDDVVRVYPGRYLENLNFNGHNITLESLYAVDPLQEYIENTIIDGNLDTCIRIVGGETGTVNGFTIVNNEEGEDDVESIAGGGIYVTNYSTCSLFNCIVRDCISIQGGGGVCITMGASVYLEGNTIFCNRATEGKGGGIYLGSTQGAFFSQTNPNSVYNNIAGMGMDIFTQNSEVGINITLSLGSAALQEPDNFFINYDWNTTPSIVNIAQGYFVQADADMYVETWGDDDNPGISPDAPLKTIARGLQRIASNPDNPHTLHIGAGTYSHSTNGELFPLSLMPYVTIEGAGTEETILDGEFLHAFFGGQYTEWAGLKSMKLTHGRAEIMNPVNCSDCEHLRFSNLVFEDNICYETIGFFLDRCIDITLDGAVFRNTVSAENLMSMMMNDSEGVTLLNTVLENTQLTDNDYNWHGFVFQECDAVVRNMVITGCEMDDASLFSYQTIYPVHSTYTLDMSNVLVYNNSITDCGYAFAPVYLQNRYRPITMNNCTFANNHGLGPFTWVYGYIDINNFISWNPDFGTDILLKNHVWNEDNWEWVNAEVSVRNSLIQVDSLSCDLPELLTEENNLYNVDPLFLGAETGLDPSDMNYYQLSANSPCIDTGLNVDGLPPMDLAGNVRLWNDIVDMGCFEYDAPPYVTTEDETTPPPPSRITVSNYPNPVMLRAGRGGGTFIEFSLPTKPQRAPVVEVFNIRGQLVRKMVVDESFSGVVRKAGLSSADKQRGEVYSTLWDCRDQHRHQVSSGVYLYKVTADGRSAAGKCMVVR